MTKAKMPQKLSTLLNWTSCAHLLDPSSSGSMTSDKKKRMHAGRLQRRPRRRSAQRRRPSGRLRRIARRLRKKRRRPRRATRVLTPMLR